MLNLSLSALARDSVRLQERIPPDHALLREAGIALLEPLEIDLEARSVGEGVLVRGEIAAKLDGSCRRCLKAVPVEVRDTVDILYEEMSPDEAEDLDGEVYPLPDRGDTLDLSDAIREQLLVRVPDYVVCSAKCRGICAHCGAELNETECDCVPDTGGSPWDALKGIKFD